MWIASLLFYFGLYVLQNIYKLEGTQLDVIADGIGIALANLVKIILFYYFAIQRSGTRALWALVFFIPKPWFGSDVLTLSLSIWSRITWVGFFSFFCISTYRLYKVNKKESMSQRKDDEKEPIDIQQHV